MARAAATVKRVTLELGGKSPSIVFADADLERAADRDARRGVRQRRSGLLRTEPGAGRSAGCFDAFALALDAAVAGWTVGDPTDPATRMGPLVSAAQRNTVEGFLAAGMGEPGGGPVPVHWPELVPEAPATGSHRPWSLQRGASGGCPERRSSVRWPRSSPSTTRRTRSACANDTPYGLSGSIWTRRRARRRCGWPSGRVREPLGQLEQSVRVQTSFGGMKQSGLGRELGLEALASYSEMKNVFVSTEPEDRHGNPCHRAEESR